MNKPSFYYPLIILIFLVNYHFYSFYQGNFDQMRKLVSNKSNRNMYEAIQSEHPYYEIWKLSQDSKKRITVVIEGKGEGDIDYTTTYFKKLKGDKNTYYLAELTLYVNYFFYPRKIETLTFNNAMSSTDKYRKGDYIISDYNFGSYNKDIETFVNKTDKEKLFDSNFLSLYKRLKEVTVSQKKYSVINRRAEKPYYIYQVIN